MLWDQLLITPTSPVPHPTSSDRQLGLTIYRLAQSVTCNVLGNVFGVWMEVGCVFFNKVVCLIVPNFNKYLPQGSSKERRMGILS